MEDDVIILNRTDDGDLNPQLILRLAERAVAVPTSPQDDVHIQTAVAVAWRNASQSAWQVGEALKQLRAEFAADGSFKPAPLQLAMKTFIHAADETFELYGKRLERRLWVDRQKPDRTLIKKYRDTVNRLGKPTAIICNHMKHRNRELATGVIVSERSGETVVVYRVTAHYGDLQDADRIIHKYSPVISYDRSFHEILHALLRVDHAAGELVARLSENGPSGIVTAPWSLGLAATLDSLAGADPWLASSETTRFDGLEVAKGSVTLCRREGRRVPEPTKRTMNSTVDAIARSVQLMM